jgi:hypothetical protein
MTRIFAVGGKPRRSEFSHARESLSSGRRRGVGEPYPHEGMHCLQHARRVDIRADHAGKQAQFLQAALQRRHGRELEPQDATLLDDDQLKG